MTYNLRSRTRARASSVSTPASEKNAPVRDAYGNFIVDIITLAHKAAQGSGPSAGTQAPAESPLTSVEGSPVTEAESPSALRPIRSYSDVVRVSSPASDQRVEQESVVNLSGINIANANESTLAEGTTDHVTFRTANEDSESLEESNDGDDRPWITVDRKGRRDKKDLADQIKESGELTVEQLKVVNAARKSLTETERRRLGRREANVGQRESTRPTTDTESKGKGVDPRNWGALAHEDEIDVEEQRVALESYKTTKQMIDEHIVQ
ncbi:uncharacterized protein HD556DRAFT_1437292 [Suillus plorans]|uniref:Uncharacterized protein n=1 Tax=Suillus plorans TaxID=116603 RepID=A0A9P7J5B7_9AGAM|nr:uncharacterized protein HD556DRAFT_1445250 [Suillus plorans]XP_041165877.1 uncharacterized protein HD556DRAFT_1437292 [Suillus plorans]KAG1791608.1 hypothetical protein HD556DRAFT_1445250 [Suillus plorans]KAG1803531.1 hypothetical protein HD556DRAFT_1437292 [Suillus plorans]